ncbi:unnamed protein product [Medioppia subpectinata]|uniref:Carboxypeptidase n=1 Tax=Medioppia subpectinata TaxID=1979941 RepID=A0A7R9KWJ4_9ACAR|nr:unnamed protein product [Medioppia subpectinata]CAG2111056.1 unnamed protein product [Medioppia subpectinata]
MLNVCLVCNALDDEIVSLPGLSKQIQFKQYSGYLNASKGRHYFYWFFECEKDPQNAPVVLWLQGGPGGSSLFGMSTENGPFRFNQNGKTVELAEHSWNSVANVLYLESPSGTGFSYDDNNNYTNTDESTALDNYLSLESFFVKFPQFKKNEFYITGESYAGVYIPMLATNIYQHNSTINLKGVAIGNGLLLDKQGQISFNQSSYDYALAHGLITTDAYEKKIESCCECTAAHGLITTDAYEKKIESCCECTAGAVQHECDFSKAPNITKCKSVQVDTMRLNNPYNIYDDCPLDTNARQVFDTYFRPAFKRIGINYRLKPNNGVNAGPECVKYGTTTYMNTNAVQKALHVRPGSKRWAPIGGPYDRTHAGTPQAETVKQLINTYNIPKLIVYNGDFDTVCNFIGNQRFVTGLGFQTAGHYREWTVDGTSDGVIGGFVQNYEKGLSFVLVRGAGHMVPSNKPEAGLQLLKGLLGLSKL